MSARCSPSLTLFTCFKVALCSRISIICFFVAESRIAVYFSAAFIFQIKVITVRFQTNEIIQFMKVIYVCASLFPKMQRRKVNSFSTSAIYSINEKYCFIIFNQKHFFSLEIMPKDYKNNKVDTVTQTFYKLYYLSHNGIETSWNICCNQWIQWWAVSDCGGAIWRKTMRVKNSVGRGVNWESVV